MKQITVEDARRLVLEALAEPHRLRILSFLLHRGAANVGDITRHLGLDQPHVSHHLRCLRNCGLVDVEASGRFRTYRLNGKTRIQHMLRLVDEHAAEHLEGILGCTIVKADA